MASQREHDPELRRAGERERLPAERGQERRIADQRDRLPGEEQAEVPMPQRLEDAQPGSLRDGAHEPQRYPQDGVRPPPRRLCPDDEPGGQGLEPRAGRTARRPRRRRRCRARRAAREVERDRRRGHVPGDGASRSTAGNRSRRWPRGLAFTASASSGGRSPSAGRAGRSSRTPASSSTGTARSRASTGRSTCSTSTSAATRTANRRRRSRATSLSWRRRRAGGSA